MGRKVFISFLGTNNYIECLYDIEGQKSQPVKYVQEALVMALCKDWANEDRIFIFCTKDAIKANWSKKEGVDGLEDRLSFKKEIVKMVPIEDGFSEDEIWSIFSAVYNKLEEEDEIYFDVTHAFRSIPMLTTVLFNYSRVMKHTKLVSIKYGAFEKLGPAYKVKDMPLEERVAPVLELKNIADLQFYTQAANDLEKFGKVESLSRAIKEPTQKGSHPLVRFANASEELVRNISINRMEAIKSGKYIININDSLKPLRKEKIPHPVKLIMDRLLSYTKDFVGKDDYKNIEAAIKWVIRYDMFPQAYTMLQEYLITRVCDTLSGLTTLEDFVDANDKTGVKNFRNFVSALLAIPDEDIANNRLKGILEEHEDLSRQLLETNSLVKDIRPNYRKLADSRNVINHAKKTDKKYESLKIELEDVYKETIEKHFTPCS